MDAWIALTDGGQLYGGGSGITGWFLASWSNDAAIWNRAVVLYAFGLSLHYFVWIKAIPESLSVLDRPNSFRASLGHLRRDLGRNTLALSACVAGAGMLVWSLSFPLGSAIYFDLALLHAWVELFFLIPKALNRDYPSSLSKIRHPLAPAEHSVSKADT